jgi:hypothetical protein
LSVSQRVDAPLGTTRPRDNRCLVVPTYTLVCHPFGATRPTLAPRAPPGGRTGRWGRTKPPLRWAGRRGGYWLPAARTLGSPRDGRGQAASDPCPSRPGRPERLAQHQAGDDQHDDQPGRRIDDELTHTGLPKGRGRARTERGPKRPNAKVTGTGRPETITDPNRSHGPCPVHRRVRRRSTTCRRFLARP